MIEINQILTGIKSFVNWINVILLWLSTQIATLAKLDVNNVYLILVIILALYLSRKLMLLIYASGEEGRTEMWLIIAAGIFILLKYFGG